MIMMMMMIMVIISNHDEYIVIILLTYIYIWSNISFKAFYSIHEPLQKSDMI